MVAEPVQQTEVKPRGAARRLDYIDALRAAACLAVLFYHHAGGRQVDEIVRKEGISIRSMIHGITGYGWLGVPLFLILSGFCLYYPIARKKAERLDSFQFGAFMIRRGQRILPPYWAAVVLAFIVAALLHSPIKPANAFDYPLHILMLHNLSYRTLGTINPVFWSLALEWQFYLLFPLFLWGVKKSGAGGLFFACAILSLVWGVVVQARFGVQLGWIESSVLYASVPGYAVLFAAGMYAAQMVAEGKHVPQWLTIGAGLALLIGLGYGAIVSMSGAVVATLWAIFFSVVMVHLGMVCHSEAKQAVYRGFVWIGTISYSIYLVHTPLMKFWNRLPFVRIHGPIHTILHWVEIPIIIALAYGFHILFERPFMRKRESANQVAAQAVAA